MIVIDTIIKILEVVIWPWFMYASVCEIMDKATEAKRRQVNWKIQKEQ